MLFLNEKKFMESKAILNKKKRNFYSEMMELNDLISSDNWTTRRKSIPKIVELYKKPPGENEVQLELLFKTLEESLIKLSKDEKWEVRHDVAMAMLGLKDFNSFDEIIARLCKDQNYDVKRAAELTLKRARQPFFHDLSREELLLSTIEYNNSLQKILPDKKTHKQVFELSQRRFELFVKASNHELKRIITPLQSRISKAKKLLSSKIHGKLKEHIAKAEERCDFLIRMVENMEEWVTESTPEFTKENLRTIIEESVNLVDEYFENSNPKLKVKKTIIIPDVYIKLPRLQIIQAFRNIIQNAYESFNKKKNILSIVGEEKEDSVVLTFQDNGCGMDNETCKLAFQPFTSTKESTGFGLPIAYKIICQYCRGSINLSACLKKGTTVRVVIPLIEDINIEHEK